ncbi:hypothetical protein Aasi_0451 [Candidatus Amoebophilus asiaticus 5a2]|uniref:U-box domain-containing protein n=1 Tax=Amoebophilus asiaticus (strain 5a2) TaxID=452471 RepID=B3ERL0_AMOA5|nr:U-box domain-containing protein [Candidatus Amoebophilus asiaticus]ACE05862.1 hypothetical protein Aasi_0451 [Candidatus Amoebophilus asiaticus 5a2]
MKKTYPLFQQYISYVLLISFFLQSCGGLNNLIIPMGEEKDPQIQRYTQQQLTPQIQTNIQPLASQELTAEGGHSVTLYQEAGKLKADVKMSASEGFSKTYHRIDVDVEQGAELASLPHLSKQAQQYRIHLQLAKGEQPAKVVIYKGAGLMGGMLQGEEEAEEEDSEDEAIPNECFCSITQEIMEDPVIAQDGHTYERAAIQQWFNTGRRTSPRTGARLLSTDLIANYTMRSLIQDLKVQIPVLARHQLNMGNIEAAIKLREEDIQQELELKGSLLQQQQQRAIQLEGQLAQMQQPASQISSRSRFSHLQPANRIRTEEESGVEGIIVFCGNPGVGKSSLCNSIFQKPVFKSGAMIGKGMTTKEQEFKHVDNLYIDTPGLDDVKLRDKAAEEIEKALKHNDNYKIIFVAMLDSGRIRPADLATVNAVCGAIKVPFEFGLIFNKVTPRIIKQINQEGLEPYLTTLVKQPISTLILKKDSDMEDEEDVYFPMNSDNRDKLVKFTCRLPGNRILEKDVNRIDITNFQEKVNEIERKYKQEIAELSKRNSEQAVRINTIHAQLQQSSEELKKQKEEFEERERIRSEELRQQREEIERIKQQQEREEAKRKNWEEKENEEYEKTVKQYQATSKCLEVREENSLGAQKQPSVMQLVKGADETLEAPLATGKNVMLKISIDLKSLGRYTEKGHMSVPARLFLTDFASSPLNYPDINFEIKVDCEATPVRCVLPHKPPSFGSYAEFTQWLGQGYFSNQVNVAYDFSVDVQDLAPSLAQYLFSIPPGGYRFIGTHVVDNIKIIPDKYNPSVSYVSKREIENTTVVELSGTLYLNKKSYPITAHRQVFPHPKIEDTVFQKDPSKKFYHFQGLVQGEITAKVTYEEFPKTRLKDWPGAPSETYNLLQKRPAGDNKEQIEHLSCLEGSTGKEVNITDGKMFSVVSAAKEGKTPIFQECIIQDAQGREYIVIYRLCAPIRDLETSISGAINSLRPFQLKPYEEPKSVLTCRYEGGCGLDGAHGMQRTHRSSCYVTRMVTVTPTDEQQKNNWRVRDTQINKLKELMREYYRLTGEQHPRWDEFQID